MYQRRQDEEQSRRDDSLFKSANRIKEKGKDAIAGEITKIVESAEWKKINEAIVFGRRGKPSLNRSKRFKELIDGMKERGEIDSDGEPIVEEKVEEEVKSPLRRNLRRSLFRGLTTGGVTVKSNKMREKRDQSAMNEDITEESPVSSRSSKITTLHSSAEKSKYGGGTKRSKTTTKKSRRSYGSPRKSSSTKTFSSSQLPKVPESPEQTTKSDWRNKLAIDIDKRMLALRDTSTPLMRG